MSYFDDKQEILKVELTTYGRHLVSRGKFKPAYYAFFDDDIIYDADYAQLSESQNSIQTRILDETPSLKPQTTYTSVENKSGEVVQISSDKNYALSLPLANSSVGEDYLPAWALRIINGEIESISEFINNSSGDQEILQPYLKYPQINLKDNTYNIKRRKNDSSTENDFETIYIYDENGDKYYYSINNQPILIDLQEMNVEELLKNFDIEMFIEEDAKIIGTDGNKKTLRKLNFKKESIAILNNILLDEPITFEVEEDDSYVEYYFELTADDEIELPPQEKSNAQVYTPNNNKAPFGVDC